MQATETRKRKTAKEEPDYFTVEVVITNRLYKDAKRAADALGEDMAHVARRILYTAAEHPADYDPDAKPMVVEGVSKTRENTRGEDPPYKNFRFRVPRAIYPKVRDGIVGPEEHPTGITITQTLEAGFLRYISTSGY